MNSDRLRTVCVALLGQLAKFEEEIDELDFDGFSALIDEQEVQCDVADKRSIFAMIDTDGGGTIDGNELKSAIRNSGAIAGMYKESLTTFGILVGLTLAFDAGIYAFKGSEAAFDFLTAYFVEDSLSVDNLFVFLLLFRYFKVPPQLVDICLNYGISGSILLRGVFIFAGLAAVGVFAPVLLGFSVFLLASSYTMLAGGEEDEDDDAPPEIVTDLLDKLPITGTFEGEKFFVETKEGLQATQLTGTLVCIALCDVLFAVDSIPAVLGVTSDPFVVYTSNIAAVVGLRSLYQLLSIAVSDLVYLEKAVAIVLGFVGLKLGVEVIGFEVSSLFSLGVIVATLGGGVGLSLLAAEEEKAAYDPSPSGVVIKLINNMVGGGKDDNKK
jgi:TerC family integral membrane protein